MSTTQNTQRYRPVYRASVALIFSLLVNGLIFSVGPLLLDRGIVPLFSPHALLNLMMPLRPKLPEPKVEEPDQLEEPPKLELKPMEMEMIEEPPPPPEIAPPELEIPQTEVPPLTTSAPALEQITPDMPPLEIDFKSLPAASIPIAVNVQPTMAKPPQITPAAPTALEDRVYGIGEVDSAPGALGQALPPYPRKARRRGIEGWVKVRFLVTKEGSVRNLTILEESPAGVFHGTVSKTVPRWRFKPAQKSGQPVDVWVEQTINFKMDR